MKSLCYLCVAALLLGASGCIGMGKASDDDKAALDAWSKAVTDKDRAEVEREASLHTEWMEEKKVQWMTQQYRRRYAHMQTKRAATQAATRAATQATTQSSSQPTSRN